ncbi:MAG: nucleotidyltransferase family protein [Actinomycetota bacterium]|nr:nucleotidyltransferase family protein [Actinomycetota bacterium]
MGGVDKASIEIAGATMLDRVLAAVRPVCHRLIVVGPARDTGVPAVVFLEEPAPGGGPVPAVAAGLAAAGDADPVLVLAADLPVLVEGDVRRLLELLATDPAIDAAAAVDHRGLPNPLLAAYRRDALAPAAGAGAAGAPAAGLLPDRVGTVDLGPDATLNVNRPAELARAVALLRSGRGRGPGGYRAGHGSPGGRT